jgi:pimeloyl-ACP methyl ester carboxylesterase
VHQIDVDGLRIAYERTGEGSPLVLLHGYVGDGRTTWRHQLDELSHDFTVIAWDAPGAGASSDPPEPWGIAEYADCLAKFLDAIGVARAHIVGLSFGGALALALYDRHRGVPLTLTLASAYAGWKGSLRGDQAEQRLRQALSLSELAPADFVEALMPTMFSADVPGEDAAAFEASMRDFHPAGFRAMARAATEDLRQVLPTVEVPTLVIYGDEDQRAPRYVAEHLGTTIPNATLVALPGVGHVCNIEAPRRFSNEVRRFVRANAV